MRDQKPRSFADRQCGFTLIEVLVAILVLSIGLLGLAGLQATSLRNNYDAYLTTQATYLANDMADRIRSNRSGPALTEYNNQTSANSPACYTLGTCSPIAMAGHDRFLWNANLLASLPAGQGNVARAGTLFTITVMWDELRNGANGTGCNPANQNDLRCVTVVTQP